MTAYLVSYDLHNQRHYQPVWDSLTSLGGVRLLESLWLVNTQLTAQQLRERVQTAADSDDSVAVIQLPQGVNWSTWNAKPPGVAFLKNHVTA